MRPTLTPLVAVAAALVCLAAILPRWDGNRFWLTADGTFYYDTARTLAATFSLEQSKNVPASWFTPGTAASARVDAAYSDWALGRDGHSIWPKHPWLLPVLAAPLVFLYGPVGALLFNCLCLLAAALLAFRLASRVAPEPAALAATLLVLLLPAVSSQAFLFSNELLVTALLLGACEAAAGERAGLSGFLAGLSLLAKVTGIAALVVLGAALLLRDRRQALRYLAGAAGPLLVLAAANTFMFGAPWITSYDRMLVMGPAGRAVASIGSAFDVGVAEGLRRVTIGPDGIGAALSVVGLAMLIGLVPLALRRPRPAAVLVILAILPLAVHATYHWYRLPFLDPTLFLGVVPLAALLGPLSPQLGGAPSLVLRPAVAVLALVPALFVHGAAFLRARAPFDAYDRVEQARVDRSGTACDFFNVQLERWECSGLDAGGDGFSGRDLPGARVGGRHEGRLLWLAAQAGRTIAWEDVALGGSTHFELALPDGAGGSPVDLLLSAGTATERVHLEAPGRFETRDLPTPAGPGRVSIAVEAAAPGARAVVARVRALP